MNDNRAYTVGQSTQRIPDMTKKQIPTETVWNGARLAELRNAAGYTQTELADAIGVTRRMVAYYETESDYPPAALLVQLAGALKLSVDELLGVTGGSKALRAPNRRVLRRLEKIEQLPKRDQDALLRTIDAFLSKAN